MLNEDSQWWTAALAQMDGSSVRSWCRDAHDAGAFVDWCWWDGVQRTRGWDRARLDFEAFAEAVCGDAVYDAGAYPTVGYWDFWRK